MWKIKLIPIQRKTEKAIRHTCRIFRENTHYFLNEHDIKAFLYNRLNEEFKEIPNGDYLEKTTRVHSEIGVFEDEKYKYRPDIMLVRKGSFNQVFNKMDDMKEWECEHYGVIEIKYGFHENKAVIKKRIQEDFDKLLDNNEDCKLQYTLYFDESDSRKSKEVLNIEDVKEISKKRKNSIKIVYMNAGLRTPILVKNGRKSKWVSGI